METKIVGLISGRHPLPVQEYIFTGAVNPIGFEEMHNTVCAFLDTTKCGNLVVYVTGLTACTVALVAECVKRGISLTLMHYNAADGTYVPQAV